MKPSLSPRQLAPAAAVAAALLAGCTTSVPLPRDPPTAPPAGSAPAPVATAPATQNMIIKTSMAADPRAYRADAAGHIYERNAARIWKGRLPPMLYAVGVLQVELDREGQVGKLHWMRAPQHAPEVIAEIEKTVREAAPFPRPARLGKVVWTDTWLWHKSGQFQLDTLTEGQD